MIAGMLVLHVGLLHDVLSVLRTKPSICGKFTWAKDFHETRVWLA